MSETRRCHECDFYDRDKQVCNHPDRMDYRCVYYYGHIDPNDYCALWMPKKEENNNAEVGKNTNI